MPLCICFVCSDVDIPGTLLKIFSLLESLSATQRQHTITLNAIERQLGGCAEEVTLPDGITLPLKSEKDFTDLEAKLCDDALRKTLVSSYHC